MEGIQSGQLGSGCEFEITKDNNKYIMSILCGRTRPIFKQKEGEISFSILTNLEEEEAQKEIAKIAEFYGLGSHTIRNNGDVINIKD